MDTSGVQPVPPQSFVREVHLQRIPLPLLRRDFGDFDGDSIVLANGDRYGAGDAISAALPSGVQVEKAKGRVSALFVTWKNYVFAFKLGAKGWMELLWCTPIDVTNCSLDGGVICLAKCGQVEVPSAEIKQPHPQALNVRLDDKHIRKRRGRGELLRYTVGDRWANYVFERRRWWRLHPYRFPESDTRGQLRLNHIYYPVAEGANFCGGEIALRPRGYITVGGRVYSLDAVISQPFSLGKVCRGPETNWLTVIEPIEGEPVKLHFENGDWCRWYESAMPMTFWERHAEFASSDLLLSLSFRFARSACELASLFCSTPSLSYCD